MGLFDERTGGLITHWRTVAGITSLVGAGTACKIWPHKARQGTLPPYLVYFRVSGEPYYDLSGPSGARRTAMHVYCFGTSLAQADALAELVKAATESMRGTYSGVEVLRVQCESVDDGFEYRQPASDQVDYWVRLVVNIVHGE